MGNIIAQIATTSFLVKGDLVHGYCLRVAGQSFSNNGLASQIIFGNNSASINQLLRQIIQYRVDLVGIGAVDAFFIGDNINMGVLCGTTYDNVTTAVIRDGSTVISMVVKDLSVTAIVLNV